MDLRKVGETGGKCHISLSQLLCLRGFYYYYLCIYLQEARMRSWSQQSVSGEVFLQCSVVVSV